MRKNSRPRTDTCTNPAIMEVKTIFFIAAIDWDLLHKYGPYLHLLLSQACCRDEGCCRRRFNCIWTFGTTQDFIQMVYLVLCNMCRGLLRRPMCSIRRVPVTYAVDLISTVLCCRSTLNGPMRFPVGWRLLLLFSSPLRWSLATKPGQSYIHTTEDEGRLLRR